MKPISSYLRHLIVTGIVLVATKYQLPEAGLSDFAEGLALLAIGTGTWLLVKYCPGLSKYLGLGAIALLAGSLSGCTGLTLTAATPWGDVSTTDGATTVAVRPIVILRDK